LDKTIAPLSNASASLAFKKDFILGASVNTNFHIKTLKAPI